MNEESIDLDIDGKRVGVPRETVRALAAAAATRAGISARHRDLSLVLGRALETGAATLGQGELRALCAVIEEEHSDGLGAVAADLFRAASG